MSAKLINIVLDLETLSLSKEAAIIQIGACVLENDREYLPADCSPYFEATIAYESCLDWVKRGFVHMDEETLKWHEEKNPNRKKVFSGQDSYTEALQAFQEWALLIKSTGADIAVWGNGVGFDNEILKHSLAVANVDNLWNYKNDRCYRTIRAMFPVAVQEQIPYDKHTGLGDAVYEAYVLQTISETYPDVAKALYVS